MKFRCFALHSVVGIITIFRNKLVAVCKSTDSFDVLRKRVASGVAHVLRFSSGGGDAAASSKLSSSGGGVGGGVGAGVGGGVLASGLKSSSNGLSLSNASIP